jgi:hypothetical protein
MNEEQCDYVKLAELWFNAEILPELVGATEKFGSFHSMHEGYAVLKEEVDELWDGVKDKNCRGSIYGEAVQVAAMAIRFLIDCCTEDNMKKAVEIVGDEYSPKEGA